MPTGKSKKIVKIPFDFVLERLADKNPVTRPMFGCHAIYLGEKIVLVLRQKKEYTDDNGVWLATSPDHHESLRKDFPSLRTIRMFGVKESSWQNIPEEASDFEESVIKACERILRNDARIGKVPKKKKKKTQ